MFNSRKAEISDLEAQVVFMASEKVMLENRLNEADGIIHNFAERERQHSKQLVDHQTQLIKVKEAHQIELKTVEASVNRKLNSALASIGVQQFAQEQFQVSSNSSDLECYNTFMSLNGGEQTEYYKLHKNQIARVQLK